MVLGKNVRLWHPQHSNIGLCSIGDDSVVHSHVWIGDTVTIGKRVRVEAFCFLPPGVVIEDDVFLGPRVTFTNDKHPPSKKWLPTIVKRGASLGAGCIILPGITIGRGAKVGAGAVVTKSVKAGETVVGNPARPLRRR